MLGVASRDKKLHGLGTSRNGHIVVSHFDLIIAIRIAKNWADSSLFFSNTYRIHLLNFASVVVGLFLLVAFKIIFGYLSRPLGMCLGSA